jgi:hypothetical protein
LLRSRHPRPRRRRATEQRDEIAASDESCHLIPPASEGCGPTIAQSKGVPRGPALRPSRSRRFHAKRRHQGAGEVRLAGGAFVVRPRVRLPACQNRRLSALSRKDFSIPAESGNLSVLDGEHPDFAPLLRGSCC